MTQLRFAFVAFSNQKEKFVADASFIYRCENLALALRAAGHYVDLVHYSNFNINNKYDLVFFHRPKRKLGLGFLLRRLRKAGTVLIADFDDLIFLPQFAHLSPGVLNKLVSQRKTTQQFKSHATALRKFDIITVSTLPLWQAVTYLVPESTVLLLPNTVHFSWYQLVADRKKTAQPLKLTYFPGTRSHDRDFAMVREPLEQFLDENPEIQLQITGVLDYEFRCRPEQLISHSKQRFGVYHKYVSESWVNIAPLEKTIFNEHKSGIKAIEAAFWHIPTIASPITDMRRLENCGAILATTPEDWYRQLNSLTDTQFYASFTHDLRHRVLDKVRIEEHANTLIHLVTTV